MSESIVLEPQAWRSSEETVKLLAAFERAGVEVRFVGGCVRDALLGRPVTDIDLATPVLPQQVIETLKDAHIKAIPTGIAHGTVTAVIGKSHFEITTLRRDVACDGRHAEVAFTDRWEEDAKRRDFTMNALYAAPSGEVIDYFKGISDARAGRIVFIGDARARIAEDALRILRFMRFFAHYGREPLYVEGLTACAGAAEKIDILSGERIHTEMMKLLAAPDPVRALEYLHTTGIWPRVLPAMWQEMPMATLIALEQEQGIPPDPVRRLALILQGAVDRKAALRELAARWKISAALKQQLQALLDASLPMTALLAEQKHLLRKTGRDAFGMLSLLAWADARARGMNDKGINKIFTNMLKLETEWDIPEFPVSGRDLLERGYKEGPELGRMLGAMEEFWEANDYKPTGDELLKKVARN